MGMASVLFNVLCGIAVIVFVAIIWRLAQEARGVRDNDEHEGGGIG